MSRLSRTKTPAERDARNVERFEAAQRRDMALTQALDPAERSIIALALTIAARQFKDDAQNFHNAAGAIESGQPVPMFAKGKAGIRAAERLAKQFEKQRADALELLERFE